MSKGDVVIIVTTTRNFAVEATKAGRTVRVKTKGAWTQVDEMTAPSRKNPAGLETGNRTKVATVSIIAIEEKRMEEQVRQVKKAIAKLEPWVPQEGAALGG